MNIPIERLRELSQKYGYDHVICFATQGEMQHVATYGTTLQACDEAAQFGDKLKDALGWPESLHAAPSRVRALQKRVKELEAACKAMLAYEKSMDGADGYGENDDKYFAAIGKMREAIEPSNNSLQRTGEAPAVE